MQFPLKSLHLAQRPAGFQIVVFRSVLNKMKQLGRKSMRAEVGGMLVGKVCWDGEPFVFVKDSIEGKYTDNRSASVTFTSKTWDYVHEQIEQHYPDLKIVGWNHTHPGFSIFLSSYDLFICRSTFNAPFHIAYVFDPHIENRPASEGFFVWRNSQVVSQRPLIIGDVPAFRATHSNVWQTNWSSGNLASPNKTQNFDMTDISDKIRITADDVGQTAKTPLPPSAPVKQEPPKPCEQVIDVPLLGKLDIYAMVLLNTMLSFMLLILFFAFLALRPRVEVIPPINEVVADSQRNLKQLVNESENRISEKIEVCQTDLQNLKQKCDTIEKHTLPKTEPPKPPNSGSPAEKTMTEPPKLNNIQADKSAKDKPVNESTPSTPPATLPNE
ncbi:MAG: hypothetical protein LBT46_10705 [Planctomycetaceae bacterium]|nr:hypothetical protein [Planctomycetaceae bacterium]